MSDEELIDFVYYEIAGKYLQERITDWADTQFWMKTVSELDKPTRYTYFVGILNMQVMNGGFQQYYDNLYGVFAPETEQALREIGAPLIQKLVKDSLTVLDKYRGDLDLLDFLKNGGHWDIKEIEKTFSTLDDQYYDNDDIEDMTKILGAYLRSKNKFERP